MKKYLSKKSLKKYKDIYKKKGLKALLKTLGWRVFALVFLFYLVRDVILYVIGPKVFLEVLSSFGISSNVSYPFFGYFVFLLITFWIYKINKDLKLKIFRIASFLGASCVILGAFGAHLLNDILENLNNQSIYNTAVNYHFFHIFLMLTLGLLYNDSNLKYLKRSFIFCLLGIFLFSGSLYLLSLTDLKWLSTLTPIGGFCFIISWFFLFFCLKKKS
tara:strand:- start:345 stop:995 length:651 start_codon:yes stop_codon:yes gene_type:complete